MAKEAKQSAAYVGGNPYADHLCVLVHGLWGNPDHMKNIARILRSSHTPDKLYMLLAKCNSGSFTYDGIELRGERVCAEIEDELQNIEARGGKIKNQVSSATHSVASSHVMPSAFSTPRAS